MASDPPRLPGILCVECGQCGRRVMLRVGGTAASIPTPKAARRLKCSACGAKRTVLFPARDEPDAKRPVLYRARDEPEAKLVHGTIFGL